MSGEHVGKRTCQPGDLQVSSSASPIVIIVMELHGIQISGAGWNRHEYTSDWTNHTQYA